MTKLEEMGLIVKASRDWASPIVIVQRPGETKIRLCVDFRELNKQILPDRYPLPRVDDLVDGAGQGTMTHFSTMDLVKGFHQIEIEKDSQDKTAFIYPNGFYKWLRVPFGIQTAPAFFQRVMHGQSSETSREREG